MRAVGMEKVISSFVSFIFLFYFILNESCYNDILQ